MGAGTGAGGRAQDLGRGHGERRCRQQAALTNSCLAVKLSVKGCLPFPGEDTSGLKPPQLSLLGLSGAGLPGEPMAARGSQADVSGPRLLPSGLC
jgi:hypothetical protein